jgi:transcriptional regulator with XRE-family HTH domain
MTAVATLEIDAECLFEALDRERRHRGLRRRQVTDQLGVQPSCWRYWEQGGGIAADVLLRACHWLDRDARDFTKGEEDTVT